MSKKDLDYFLEKMIEIEKIDILNVGISQVNISDIVEIVPKFIKSGKKGYVTVTGVHGIIESQNNKRIMNIHNESFMSIPDGMPCVWVSKLKGSKNIKRCFGPEVFAEIMKISRKHNIKHFFYGGDAGVANQLKKNMENLYSGIDIVGTYCPPFRPLNDNEEFELANKIEKISPDIIWVGLSTPKQEIFMNQYISKLNTKLMFGVGAAFDYHAGSLAIAPKWIQNLGLEWLFRLAMEPRRLWKRYFEIIPKFIFYNLLEFLKVRK